MQTCNTSAPEGFFNRFIARQQSEYLHLLTLLNRALKADFLLLAQVNRQQKTAETLLVLHSGKVIDNFIYYLAGTPCENVHDDNACLIVDDVTIDFPHDQLLKDMGVVAYMGLPIQCDGDSIGLIIALSQSNSHHFNRNYFFVEMFVKQLSAELSSEWQKSQLDSYQKLLDEVCTMSAIGAWEYSITSNSLYWSKEVYQIYGIPFDSALTPELGISFYTNEDRAKITQLFSKAVTTGLPYQADLQFTDAFGRKKWIRTSGKVEYDPSGNPSRVFGAIADVTDEITKLKDEQEQHRYLKGVLDSINDAVITIDRNGDILDCNKASELIFGYTTNELIALKINSLMPEPFASQHDRYIHHFQRTGEAKIIGVGRQLPAKRKNGDIFQMELSLCEYKHNEDILYIGIVRDITARIQANDSIYRLAYIDTVTGLKNKASFEKTFRNLQTQSFYIDNYIYVAYLDIDGLARLNLAYGISDANNLLMLISRRLESVMGKNFSIYRYTSDEFIVVSNKGVLQNSLDELRYNSLEKKMQDPELYRVTLNGEPFNISVSTASMVVQLKSLKQETLLDYLEYGMQQAKRNAPSGHFVLTPMDLETYDRTKLIKNYISRALQDDEFYIVLQPQFKSNNYFMSSEVLLRWHSDELGFISPAEFIPLAEENNQIIYLGDWVIEQACKLLSKVKEEGIITRIAINISSKQLVQPDFQKKLLSTIKKYSISADSLILELTETVLISDIELVKKKMLSLAKLGYLFSIDDFGTGYSSLSYIKELPISELKIDKCFIAGIGSENSYSSASIVNAVLDMAKALHLEVVAEGVETYEQYEYLRQRGCDIIQGYLLSKPLSVDDWLRKLREYQTQCAITD